MKKMIALFLVCILSLGVVAGCSKSDDSSDSSSKKSSSDDEDSSGKSLSSFKVRIAENDIFDMGISKGWADESDPDYDYFSVLSDDDEARLNITIEDSNGETAKSLIGELQAEAQDDDSVTLKNESTGSFSIGKYKGQRYKFTMITDDEELFIGAYVFVQDDIAYKFTVLATNSKLVSAAEDMISSFTLLGGSSSGSKKPTETAEAAAPNVPEFDNYLTGSFFEIGMADGWSDQSDGVNYFMIADDGEAYLSVAMEDADGRSAKDVIGELKDEADADDTITLSNESTGTCKIGKYNGQSYTFTMSENAAETLDVSVYCFVEDDVAYTITYMSYLTYYTSDAEAMIASFKLR